MNITVYLGSREGNDPNFVKGVEKLGSWIGLNGHTLVYGGSKTGLMGKLAQSALKSNGKVIGVETQNFVNKDFQYHGLTKLIVTKDIKERRSKMIELGQAFIAFPGGTGTLEEISEVMSKVSLKELRAPCIIYNLDGYYNSLKTLLDHMVDKGLSSKDNQEGIYFVSSLYEIEKILKNLKSCD